MTRTNLFTVSAIAAVFMFASCGGEKKPDPNVTDIEVTKDTIKDEVRVDLNTLKDKIPPPSELSKKFSAAGIAYNKSALLSTSKAGSYSTKYSQALGLGAYGADLGFACAYNQSQDALECLNAIGKLSNDLGVSSAFDKDFVTKIVSNIGKSDSLEIMIQEANDKAERNMRSNQRVQSAVLMMCGGWVEGLYVAAENLKSKKDDPKSAPVYKEIYTHTFSWTYIDDLLKQFKGNADIDKFRADVTDNIGTIWSIGGDPGFGAANFDKFYEAISALRNKVLN